VDPPSGPDCTAESFEIEVADAAWRSVCSRCDDGIGSRADQTLREGARADGVGGSGGSAVNAEGVVGEVAYGEFQKAFRKSP
jgi:hypothetical protein